MKNYVLDLSCLDSNSSGAKQRILSIYTNLVSLNKNIIFTLITTDINEFKKYFIFDNVIFKKNPFKQSNYFNKILSVFYVYCYLTFNKKKYHVVEHFTLPFIRIKNATNIITIHDLRKIYFSNFFIFKSIIKLIYKIFFISADKILVVSKTAKKELKSYFKKKKNIIVSYNVLSNSYLDDINLSDLYKIKKKYFLPKKFIISVGHLEKRKNFLNLIKAINILKKNNINIKLIIVGQISDQYKIINDELERLNLNSDVKIFSNLNDYELKCFYRLAELYVYPSIYEGFGIPMLECMALNLPMVLSRKEIFMEITKGKYQYFDPHDPLSIANKINFVFNNVSMKKKMISYGQKRLKLFDQNYQAKKLINSIIS